MGEQIKVSDIWHDRITRHRWRVTRVTEDAVWIGPCNRNGAFPRSWRESEIDRTAFLENFTYWAHVNV